MHDTHAPHHGPPATHTPCHTCPPATRAPFHACLPATHATPGYYEMWSMSGRYGYYWNASLLLPTNKVWEGYVFYSLQLQFFTVSHSVDRGACMAGGGGMCGGGHVWQGVCVAGHAWKGACVVGGMCGGRCAWQGHAWWGYVCGRGMHGTHGPRQILRDTVNERVVRILLECILVRNGSPSVLSFELTVFSNNTE